MSSRIEREAFSLADIARTRLDDWAKSMGDHNATPVCCVAIGHGPNEGELHLYTPINFSDDDLVVFLAFAFREAKKRATDSAAVRKAMA